MAVNPSYGGAMSGLARALVQHGRLPENVAEELTVQARNHGSGFLEQLVTSRKMSTLDIAEFASRTFGLPLLDLEALDAGALPLDLVDKKLMRERRVLPLRKRGNRLAVAVSDPSNTQVLDEVKFQTSMSIDPIVVEDDKLRAMLARVLERAESSLEQLIDEDLSVEFADDETQNAAIEAAASEVDDAPVVRFIQKMLLDAISDGASDIHFEPYEKFYRIRFRIDGDLREIAQPPLVHQGEDRLAHQGHLEARHLREARAAGRADEAGAVEGPGDRLPRVDAADPVRREDRAADPRLVRGARWTSTRSATNPSRRRRSCGAIQRPYGMVLVTGPTGSGKTVSLYTCLNILNKPGDQHRDRGGPGRDQPARASTRST